MIVDFLIENLIPGELSVNNQKSTINNSYLNFPFPEAGRSGIQRDGGDDAGDGAVGTGLVRFEAAAHGREKAD